MNQRSLPLESVIHRGILCEGTELIIMLDSVGIGLMGRLAAVRDGLLVVAFLPASVPGRVTEPGTPLEIRWTGDDFSEYRLAASLLRYIEDKNVAVFQTPERVIRVQRRAFFRVDTDLPVDFAVVECSRKPTLDLASVWIPGTVVNLSGGGCKLMTACVLPENCTLMLRIRLEQDADPHAVKGAVLRVEPGRDCFFYGIAFREMGQAVQDDIVEYVVQTEAKRAKGSVTL